MATYLGYVQILKGSFIVFDLVHVPKEHNAQADLLAMLASSGKGEGRGRSYRKPSRHREHSLLITWWAFTRSVRIVEGRGVIGR